MDKTRKRQACSAPKILRKRRRRERQTRSRATTICPQNERTDTKVASETETHMKKMKDSGFSQSSSSPSSSTVSGDVTSSSSAEDNTSRAKEEIQYIQHDLLGQGGFGRVYAGHREPDGIPVAIKHIPLKRVKWVDVVCNEEIQKFPREVFLMLNAAAGHEAAGSSAAIVLLDWCVTEDKLLLFMERPCDCSDLFHYVQCRGGVLEESEAKIILRQMVTAAIHFHKNGVFHRDIKMENILIEEGLGEPRARVIDFGCGSMAVDGPFREFSGTPLFMPPDYILLGKYEAAPTTVWQLGVLLYSLLKGPYHFSTKAFLNSNVNMNLSVSRACQDFLNQCLRLFPEDRASLEELKLHPWLQE